MNSPKEVHEYPFRDVIIKRAASVDRRYERIKRVRASLRWNASSVTSKNSYDLQLNQDAYSNGRSNSMEPESNEDQLVLKATVAVEDYASPEQLAQSNNPSKTSNQSTTRHKSNDTAHMNSDSDVSEKAVDQPTKGYKINRARLRGYLSKRKYQCVVETIKTRNEMQQHQVSAATSIQSVFRAHLCAKRYVGMVKSIIYCQSIARRNLAIRQARMTTILNDAATTIQTAYRSHSVRVKTLTCLLHQATAMRLQAFIRGCMARTKYSTAFQSHSVRVKTLTIPVAATTLQSCIRGYMARMKYLGTISGIKLHHRAVWRVQIQKFRREYSVRVAGMMRDHDGVGPIRTPTTRSSHENGSHLALQLQALYRGFRTRQQLCKAVDAAIAIQSSWRAYICHSDYALTVTDVIIVQSVMRRWLASNQIQRMQSSLPHTPPHVNTNYPVNTPFGTSDEFVDDVASCCSDSLSSEDELMEETHLSFEEEIMSELQNTNHSVNASCSTSDEFVDDVASCCSDSSSLEDALMEEMHCLSAEEDIMSELQIAFHEKIAKIQQTIFGTSCL